MGSAASSTDGTMAGSGAAARGVWPEGANVQGGEVCGACRGLGTSPGPAELPSAMQQPWRGHLARLAALEPLGRAKGA
jgi:hypothetical protein